MHEKYGIPGIDPVPRPEPEHQRRITRQKWFEIVIVVMLIAGGTSFLAWRNNHSHTHHDPATSMAESVHHIEAAGPARISDARILERRFISLQQPIDAFVCNVDLVASDEQAPLETAIVWLTPTADQWPPTSEALQYAVNRVGQLAQGVVSSTGEALLKASKTMSTIRDAPRPYDKGVAATSDGWKLTYITYHSFDENAAPQPALVLVLHRLAAASDPALADLNRELYKAIEAGHDVKTALRAFERGTAGT